MSKEQKQLIRRIFHFKQLHLQARTFVHYLRVDFMQRDLGRVSSVTYNRALFMLFFIHLMNHRHEIGKSTKNVGGAAMFALE